jgi:hypothetical protein
MSPLPQLAGTLYFPSSRIRVRKINDLCNVGLSGAARLIGSQRYIVM